MYQERNKYNRIPKDNNTSLFQSIMNKNRYNNPLPRLSYDNYKNTRLKDLQTSLDSHKSTPKNARLKLLFQQKIKDNKQLNDQSISTIAKETHKFNKSPYKKSFAYQSIHSNPQRKSRLSRLNKYETLKRQTITTQPNQQKLSVFDSLQQNLLECDKILSKLNGFSIQKPELKTTKRQFMEWNREVKAQTSLSTNKQKDINQSYYESSDIGNEIKQRQFNNSRNSRNSRNHEFKRIFQNDQSQEKVPIYKINSQPLTQPLEIPYQQRKTKQTINKSTIDFERQPQQSVIDIRRKRINQIIKGNKNKQQQNPMESNIMKIKQRGQNLFNKVLRVKESRGGDIFYESQVTEKPKFI